MDDTVLSANTPCLPFLCKRSSDGASPNSGRRHSQLQLTTHLSTQRDERLSWHGRLTYSGRFTHISGHPSATGRVQDTESSPAKDRRSTAVPRNQPVKASTSTLGRRRHLVVYSMRLFVTGDIILRVWHGRMKQCSGGLVDVTLLSSSS